MSTATVAAPPAPTRRRRFRHHLGRVVRRTQGDLRRARGTARRAGLAVRAPVRHVRGFAARSTALRSVHVRLRRQLLDGRGTTVPVDRLLLGGVNRLSAHEYATRSDDLLWPSTKVIDGPHVDLLRRAATAAMTDAELLRTPYAAHARACIDLTGDYFGARSDTEVLEVARAFLATSGGAPPTPRPGRTPIGDPVRVKRIRHSDCYQVVDGHHRIALAIVGGNTEVEVAVERASVVTPLQELVERLAWTSGRRELYQPIPAPELESEWMLVRRCTDRLAMMDDVLATRRDIPTDATYLDVGSCYGWYVNEMRGRGLDVHGIELDPTAIALGEAVFAIEPGLVSQGECSEFLAAVDAPFDVVSCFSVLHHFALGNGPCSAEALLERLDHATGSVLFFDTGEAHEAWFRDLLPQWTPAFIASWLLEHSTFREVVALGTDGDAVDPFADNYGRTLFCCTR
jgi:Methyltransferase domain